MKLTELTRALQSSMARMSLLDDTRPLDSFSGVRQQATELSKRFDQAGPAPVPPSEKRQQALRRFLAAEMLNQTEWRLVFAGLADPLPKTPAVLEQDIHFSRLHAELQQRISTLRLSRRDWLNLCYSYFLYDAEQPESNRNWLQLRDAIKAGFAALRQQSVREKTWMHIVEQNSVLFTDQAGIMLGEQLLRGEIDDLSSLQVIAQIPDSSWLWRRIFEVLVKRTSQLSDEELLQRMPGLLALGRRFPPSHRNALLAACLGRYYQSEYRMRSLELLKQHTLEAWGSPQLRSRQNVWLQHVAEPVCRMVMSWFARDDIELFFSLLKGESGVDQARLFYWLRFADQMTYTRIVMGPDAWHATDPDFVEFRKSNRGRIGRLAGGPTSNNAVIMQIGDYLFVEFSATGNACYVYKASNAPFRPEQEQLNLNHELKQQGAAIERLPHTPRPYRNDVVDGWLLKFDEYLQHLGVLVSNPAITRPAPTKPASRTIGAAKTKAPSSSLDLEITSLLEHGTYRTVDTRAQGGGQRVIFNRTATTDEVRNLMRIGFKEIPHSARLVFWRN